MSDKAFICCFCERAFSGWGNNPYPVNKEDDARCCDACNGSIVVPARLYLASLKARKEK